MEEKFENLEYATLKQAKAYDTITKIHGFRMHSPLVKLILRIKKEGLLLDMGCGPARELVKIVRHSRIEAIGLDISLNMLKIAKENLKERLSDRVRFVLADMHNLPFKINAFEIIISLNALHHTKDIESILAKAQSLLKPNGIIIIQDLILLPKFLQNLYTFLFYSFCTKEMKKQYRDSLEVGKSLEEWQGIVNNSFLKGAKILKVWPHFVIIIKEFN